MGIGGFMADGDLIYGDGLRLLRIIDDGRYRVNGGTRDRAWFKKWLEMSGRESMGELAERLFWEQVNYKIENYLPRETITLANDDADLGIKRLQRMLVKTSQKKQWREQLRQLQLLDAEVVRGADFAVDKERIRILSDLALRLYTKMIADNNLNHHLVGQFRACLDDIAKETGGRRVVTADPNTGRSMSLAEIIKIMNDNVPQQPYVESITAPVRLLKDDNNES